MYAPVFVAIQLYCPIPFPLELQNPPDFIQSLAVNFTSDPCWTQFLFQCSLTRINWKHYAHFANTLLIFGISASPIFVLRLAYLQPAPVAWLIVYGVSVTVFTVEVSLWSLENTATVFLLSPYPFPLSCTNAHLWMNGGEFFNLLGYMVSISTAYLSLFRSMFQS